MRELGDCNGSMIETEIKIGAEVYLDNGKIDVIYFSIAVFCIGYLSRSEQSIIKSGTLIPIHSNEYYQRSS